MSAGDDEFNPDVLDALVLGLPEASPGESLRKKLLQRVSTRDRFVPFLDRIVQLFDLPEAEARDHLDSIDRPDDWEALTEGVLYRDFEGGPAVGEAHGGLIRVAPGHVFPHHAHIGEERLLLIQGEMKDEQGQRYRAGDLLVSADGTAHALTAVGDREAIYVVLVVGIAFSGEDDDDDDED
jgi:quercetin dioxygenase-like cupin family protein